MALRPEIQKKLMEALPPIAIGGRTWQETEALWSAALPKVTAVMKEMTTDERKEYLQSMTQGPLANSGMTQKLIQAGTMAEKELATEAKETAAAEEVQEEIKQPIVTQPEDLPTYKYEPTPEVADLEEQYRETIQREATEPRRELTPGDISQWEQLLSRAQAPQLAREEERLRAGFAGQRGIYGPMAAAGIGEMRGTAAQNRMLQALDLALRQQGFSENARQQALGRVAPWMSELESRQRFAGGQTWQDYMAQVGHAQNLARMRQAAMYEGVVTPTGQLYEWGGLTGGHAVAAQQAKQQHLYNLDIGRHQEAAQKKAQKGNWAKWLSGIANTALGGYFGGLGMGKGLEYMKTR